MSRPAPRLAGVVLGCCLLAAISGCSFHRTAHGFILHGGRWSLDHHRENRDPAAKEASAKPEVLPWRSRLKGYRLGARIFHERDPAAETPPPAKNADGLPLPDSVLLPPDPKRPDLVLD